jgi:hypothetical protein
MAGNPPPPPAAAQDALVRAESRWHDCTGPDAPLLKLATLRELVRGLHIERSRCLATGRKEETLAIKFWESRAEELRNSSSLDGGLKELLAGAPPARKRTRLLPEALLASLDKSRFERYDRQWEAALAAEACTLGWRFWALDAWVEVSQAEEWNARLQELSWPYAVVLFAEPAPGSERATDSDAPLWRGRWTLVVHPRFNSASELSLDLPRWPGSPPSAPQPPQWKLLFSPKGR